MLTLHVDPEESESTEMKALWTRNYWLVPIVLTGLALVFPPKFRVHMGTTEVHFVFFLSQDVEVRNFHGWNFAERLDGIHFETLLIEISVIWIGALLGYIFLANTRNAAK
jgi:hypothetical protein